MNGFVSCPNLPHKVEHLLIGEYYSNILVNSLKNLDIHTIFIPNNPLVDKRLSGHCDLSVLHGGGEKLFLAPYLKSCQLVKMLQDIGANISFPQIEQGEKYPNDAQLNMTIAGKKLIFNIDVSSDEIVRILTWNRGLEPVNSRQGYSKCSVCVVDSNSIITSDVGITRAARKCGLSVLQISPGYVDLSGFDFGFIGGASFKLADDTMAFTGSLDGHPDKRQIIDFLRARGISPVYLTSEPIFDIGGAVPFTEK